MAGVIMVPVVTVVVVNSRILTVHFLPTPPNGFFFQERNFSPACLSNSRRQNRTEKNAATKGLPMSRPHSPLDRSAHSPLEIYLREINQTPLLNPAQWKEVACRVA